MLLCKSLFSIRFQLVSAHCVIQLFLSYTFSFCKTENLDISARERLRKKGKNETKSNNNKNMRTYLLCMTKGWSSVDEKITKK